VYTPLMIAASYGHTEALALLLAAGADVNGKDSQVGILCCTLRPLTSVEVFCFEILNFSAERPRS
jgi:ankyrin repeat protein